MILPISKVECMLKKTTTQCGDFILHIYRVKEARIPFFAENLTLFSSYASTDTVQSVVPFINSYGTVFSLTVLVVLQDTPYF